jgi:hypothetical protein
MLLATTSITNLYQLLGENTPAEQAGEPRPGCAMLGQWQQHCRGLFPDANRRLSMNSPRTGFAPLVTATTAVGMWW